MGPVEGVLGPQTPQNGVPMGRLGAGRRPDLCKGLENPTPKFSYKSA